MTIKDNTWVKLINTSFKPRNCSDIFIITVHYKVGEEAELKIFRISNYIKSQNLYYLARQVNFCPLLNIITKRSINSHKNLIVFLNQSNNLRKYTDYVIYWRYRNKNEFELPNIPLQIKLKYKLQNIL